MFSLLRRSQSLFHIKSQFHFSANRMSELLKGVQVVLPDGKKVNGEEHLKGKVVALYFSAGWCPPCRAFTPKLKVSMCKFFKVSE
uniref:Thioredoxin-like_fold domain-containing protein n=1 Tax=Bursaphelenchus xylophilus TaxID=6326 RepID=A0A1I7RHR8_BURXY